MKRVRTGSVVGVVLVVLVVLGIIFAPRLGRDALVIAAANGLVVAMFLRLAFQEERHRRQAAVRLLRHNDPAREAHLSFLRTYLKETGANQTSEHLAKLYNQIRVYVRDTTSEPVDLPEIPGGYLGLGTLSRKRSVSHRVFVVVPRDGDPYWLACNRPVEAMKYCRRVHPGGFGIALWTKPVPRAVRLVDLIG